MLDVLASWSIARSQNHLFVSLAHVSVVDSSWCGNSG